MSCNNLGRNFNSCVFSAFVHFCSCEFDTFNNLPLTLEQRKVVGHEFKPKQLVRIIAYPGTGRKTTLVACVEAHPQLRFLYTSFKT